MKIFGLGGYGTVGKQAAKVLAQNESVSRIAIVGRNLEKAEKTAHEIGEKALAIQADCSDIEKLISLVSDYDIIMNAALDDTVVPSIKAALKTKTNYCDINVGDINNALRLSEDAKAANITAVIANGICPCISNLMGVHAANHLDEVKQLQLGFSDIVNFQLGEDLKSQQWLQGASESFIKLQEFKPFFQWMFQLVEENRNRTIFDFHKNHLVHFDPVKKGMNIPLTNGDNALAYPYAITDPLFDALPIDLSTESPVEVFFTVLPPQLHQLLREISLQVSESIVTAESAIDLFFDSIEGSPTHYLTLPKAYEPLEMSKLWVQAIGYKKGKPAKYECWFPRFLWKYSGYFLTSMALAAGVLTILHGEVLAKGVITGEKAFDPQPFFKEIYQLLPEVLSSEKFIDESLIWSDQLLKDY